MAGALIVIVLAGLLVPITLLLLAVVFDAIVVAWSAYEVGHDWLVPRLTRIRRSFHLLHWPHLSHRPH